MRKTTQALLAACFCIHVTASAQQAITAVSSTTTSVTANHTYTAGGANGDYPNTYDYRYGSSSGSTNNKVFLNNFTAGGQAYFFDYGMSITVVLNRVNNGNVTGPRDLLYNEGAINTVPNPDQINIYAPYIPSMTTLFVGNDDLRSGTDNLFCNQGNGNGNNNNIERLDVRLNGNSGFIVGNPTQEGFAVFERGLANGHDGFVVSIITSLDGSGNPSGYATPKRMAGTNYNTASNPIGNSDYIVSRRENGTGNMLISAVPTGQGVGGIFFTFNDFGIPAGTRIYGYSLAGTDFPVAATGADLVNYNSTTNFPTNTAEAAGGIDLAAITGIFKIFNDDLDGINNSVDVDDDNDGILDVTENNNINPYGDTDGDGMQNYVDPTPGTGMPAFVDGNSDGINDAYDADKDGHVNQVDLDSDNDGIPDIVEAGGVDQNGNGFIDGGVADSDNDGLMNPYDASTGGVNITNLDTDGDGIPNFLDLDSDNDGIPDTVEAGGVDANGDGRVDAFLDADSDGYDDTIDGDSGNDGVAENTAKALLVTGADGNADGRPDSYPQGVANTDGRSLPNAFDLDSDNDGIADVVEAGGVDADNNGKADSYTDTDGDGFADTRDGDVGNDGSAENTANVLIITGSDADDNGRPDSYPRANADGAGVPNAYDLDSDNDGVPDLIESGGIDSNGDGRIDGLSDTDGNGWQNDYDPTQGGINIRLLDANGTAAGGGVFDFDGDGIPNYLDLDADNDGVPDIIEQGGIDANNNGKVDVATDIDNDGFSDLLDPLHNGTGAAITGAAPLVTTAAIGANSLPTLYSSGDNFDGNGLMNMLDLDSDDDGISDVREAGFAAYDSTANSVISTGDTGFADANGDGWRDGVTPSALPNTDGTGGANYLDIDADNDGIVDNIEGQGSATAATYIAPAGADTDADGIDNAYDLAAAFGGAGIMPNNQDGTDNPDYTDLDSDNDGYGDRIEGWDTSGNNIIGSGETAYVGAADADSDGLLDEYDANDAAINPANGTTPASYPNMDRTSTYQRDWREGNDRDGDGVLDHVDIDDDNDGIPDTTESGNTNPMADADGDGNPNYLDPTPGGSVPAFADANSDGISDAFDKDRDGIINAWDLDSDNDALSDLTEAGGFDGDGNGVVDGFMDTNGNGLTNAHDPLNSGTALANGDTDNDGIVNALDLDADNDGVPDLIENGGVDVNGDGRIDAANDADGNGWRNSYDPTQSGINIRLLDANGTTAGGGIFDYDGDGVPNYLDADSDGDGIPDGVEQGGTDSDNNGRIDVLTDADADGFADVADPLHNATGATLGTAIITTGTTLNAQNLPASFSPGDNLDAAGLINMLDLDADGDGVTDVREAALTDADNNGQADGAVGTDGWSDAVDALSALSLPNTDGSGNPNYLDIDADDDGITDNVEAQLTATYAAPSGSDGDADGLDNRYDDLSGYGGNGLTPVNTDGVDNPDYTDTDSDNDVVSDRIEGNDYNGNSQPDDTVAPLGTDADGDGLDDRYETATNNGPVVTIFGFSGSGAGGRSPAGRSSTFGERDWRNNLSVLPVRFIHVNAKEQRGGVLVTWTVSDEADVKHYEVERSVNGSVFETVSTVAYQPSGNSANNYRHIDGTAVGGSLAYRIRQVDEDGGFTLSTTARVQIAATTGLQLFPNPVQGAMRIELTAAASQQVTLVVTNAGGALVAQQRVAVQKGRNTISAPALGALPAGTYLLTGLIDGKRHTTTFIKH